MTICRQWAWKPDDKMKSLEECIRTLVTCAGGDGNLLFNVGPMPDGRIEPRQVERLKEMGAWLEKNGESIYGTRGGPVKPGPGFVTTRKGNTIYLHVFANAPEEIVLPELPRKVVSAEMLGGGPVEVKEIGDSWTVIAARHAAAADRHHREDHARRAPRWTWRRSRRRREFRRPTASNVFQKQPDYAAGAWRSTAIRRPAGRPTRGPSECWLEAGLVKPGVIRGIEIDEAAEYAGRVEKFVIKLKSGGEWKTVAEGTKLGKFRVDFDPVEASARAPGGHEGERRARRFLSCG